MNTERENELGNREEELSFYARTACIEQQNEMRKRKLDRKSSFSVTCTERIISQYTRKSFMGSE